jgi:hypothetical protein
MKKDTKVDVKVEIVKELEVEIPKIEVDKSEASSVKGGSTEASTPTKVPLTKRQQICQNLKDIVETHAREFTGYSKLYTEKGADVYSAPSFSDEQNSGAGAGAFVVRQVVQGVKPEDFMKIYANVEQFKWN